MLTSHRRSQNYSDPMGGQTLFEFLKRKKKFALQVSLSKSRKQNARPIAESYSPKKRQTGRGLQQTLQLQSNIKCNTHRNTATPHKFTSANVNKKNRQTSFIQMISPLRRNQEKSLTPENHRHHDNQAKGDNDRKQQSIGKKKTEQVFYRKNLNKSITAMKEVLTNFINDGKIIKEKAHTVFIQLKPILKFVEEGSNKNFAARADQLKLKLRSFQHMFKQFNIQNSNHIIQNLHRNLQEHIISLQGKVRGQLQKSDTSNSARFRLQKEKKIQTLTEQVSVLQKDLQLVQRRLDKSQRENQRLKQKQQSNSQKHSSKLTAKQTVYQQKIAQYENEINILATQLDQLKQKQKDLEKKVKDATYLKQQAEKRFIEQNAKIRSTKEDYLLNEIQILKKEFKNDMKQLTMLYKEKQVESQEIIEQLKKDKADLVIALQNLRGVQKKVGEEILVYRAQTQKFKKQNQCLVTDLNRMNEELYQHWLALKDIKTLAFRLQIFPKFQRIYLDLPYNDQLFL